MQQQKLVKGVLLLAITVLAWGATFPIGKPAAVAVDAYWLSTIRYAFTGLAFAAILAAVEGRRAFDYEGKLGAAVLVGVIGFAGTKDRPIPMRQSEVDAMLSQIKEREEHARPAISFEVGDTVKVADGPFQSQNGIVEEIDPERGKLRVAVTIFGRSTPVELEYWQVERA